VIDAAFFSLQDRKSPLKAAVVALVANIGLSVILMFPLQHGGIALATSLASAINVTMLFAILTRKIGRIFDRTFYEAMYKTALASLAMWLAIVIAGSIVPWDAVAPFRTRLLHLFVCMAAGGLTFFLASYAMRLPEVMSVGDAIRKKLRR